MTQTACAAAVVAEPENLYNNITRGVVNAVEGLLPANKAEVKVVKAEFEAYKAKSNLEALKAEFTEYKAESEAYKNENKAESEAYKNETTAVVNALVQEVNSLTPVSRLFQNRQHAMRVDKSSPIVLGSLF